MPSPESTPVSLHIARDIMPVLVAGSLMITPAIASGECAQDPSVIETGDIASGVVVMGSEATSEPAQASAEDASPAVSLASDAARDALVAPGDAASGALGTSAALDTPAGAQDDPVTQKTTDRDADEAAPGADQVIDANQDPSQDESATDDAAAQPADSDAAGAAAPLTQPMEEGSATEGAQVGGVVAEDAQADDALLPAVTATIAPEKENVSITWDEGMTQLVLRAAGGRMIESSNVAFRVSCANGVIWLQPDHNADGSWTITVPVSRLGSGEFTVEAWYTLHGVTSAGLSTKDSVSIAKCASQAVWDPDSLRLEVEAWDVIARDGVHNLAVKVDGNGITRWYDMDLDDGDYVASISMADFGWEQGTYTCTVYVRDNAGAVDAVGASAAKVSYGDEACAAVVADDLASITLSASGGRITTSNNVAFKVYSSGYCTWVAATKADDGSWSCALDAASFTGSPDWKVEAWATVGGRNVPIAASAFELSAVKCAASLTFDPANQTLVATATDLASVIGHYNLAARICSPDGTVRWFDMPEVSEGTWSATVSPASFGWRDGSYSLDVYVATPDGAKVAGRTGADVTSSPVVVSYTVDAEDGNGCLTTSGGRVAFASNIAYHLAGTGRWIATTMQADGSWSAGVDLASLGGTGAYTVEVWQEADGKTGMIATQVVGFACGSASMQASYDYPTQALDVVIDDVEVIGGARNAAVCVCDPAGRNHWFDVPAAGDGTYAGTISLAGLGGAGKYVVTGYIAPLSGKTFSLAPQVLDIKANPGTTVSDLVWNGSASSMGVVHGVEVDGTDYLMLPSNADLGALAFDVCGADGQACPTYEAFDSASGQWIPVSAGDALDVAGMSGGADADGFYYLWVRADAGQEPSRIGFLKAEGISTVYLVSSDPENEGREWIESTRYHTTSTTGSMLMTDAGGNVIYDGDFKQIKGRGNASWVAYEKKPYQIKLTKGTSLIDGTKANKAKTWLLIANASDSTMMRNYIATKLGLALGLDETPDCEYVSLYYDGEYRGLYQLTEKVEVNGGRVDIYDLEGDTLSTSGFEPEDNPVAVATNSYGNEFHYVTNLSNPDDITGGYLLELDWGYYQTERCWFMTSQGPFVVKSPENASYEQMLYISEYFQKALDATSSPTEISNYWDMDSMSRYFLVQGFMKEPDYTISSTFFYKDLDGKIMTGPLWDNDMAAGNYRYHPDSLAVWSTPDDIFLPWGWWREDDTPWFTNQTFRAAVRELFNGAFIPIIGSLIGNGGDGSVASVDQLAQQIKSSVTMNDAVSDDVLEPFSSSVGELKKWFIDRFDWMNGTINSRDWL